MYLQIFVSFLIGMLIGWVLECIYRSLENKKFVMPKFINYQMYGLVGAFLTLLYFLNLHTLVKIGLMLIFPTVIEFLTGYLDLKLEGIHLWDYSKEPYNFMGLICLPFSSFWFVVALVYYYLILPVTLNLF